MTPTEELMRSAALGSIAYRTQRNKERNRRERANLNKRFTAMRALEGPGNEDRPLTSAERAEREAMAAFVAAAEANPVVIVPPASVRAKKQSQSPPSPRRLEYLLGVQRRNRFMSAKRRQRSMQEEAARRGRSMKLLSDPLGIFLPEHAKFVAFKDRIKALDTFDDGNIGEEAPVETDYDTYKKQVRKFRLLEECVEIMNPPLPEENGIKYNASSPALNMKRRDSEYYSRVKAVHDRIDLLTARGIAYINSPNANVQAAAPTLVAELTSTATRLHMAAHVAIKENISFVEDILLRTANTCLQHIQAIIAKNTPLKTEIGATLTRLKAFEDRQSLLREMPENTQEAMQIRLSKIETLQGMLRHVTDKGDIYGKELKALSDFIAGYGSSREKYEADIARIKGKITTLGKGKTIEKALSGTLRGLLPAIQGLVNTAEAAAEASVAAEEAVAGAPEAGAPPRTKAQARALLVSLETVVDECVGLVPSSVNADNPNLEQDIREIRAALQKLGAVQANLMAFPPETFEVMKPGIGSLLEVDITAMDQVAVNTAIDTKIAALRASLEDKERIFGNLDGLKLSKIVTVQDSYADQCAVEMLALVRAFPAKPPAATAAETEGAKVMASLLH
jgi:hypothetical protein